MEAVAVSPEYLRDGLEAGLTVKELAKSIGASPKDVQLQIDALRMTDEGRRALGDAAKGSPLLTENKSLQLRNWKQEFLEEYERLGGAASISRGW